jgi:two-component system chemotaxis response regulator CheB
MENQSPHERGDARDIHDIIVVGTSAGGIEALQVLVRDLPPDIAAALFVVMHTPPHSPNMLPMILEKVSKLPIKQPSDGESIRRSHIYLAPPDNHMLLEPGKISVAHGPKENRQRPAIDPLFRSASRAYGPRVIGVVLTGMLADGTAGLKVIKSRGGLAIVQDPGTALYPGMPASAINNVEVDHVVPLHLIAPTLAQLVGRRSSEGVEQMSEELDIETGFAEMEGPPEEAMNKLGSPSVYACPECHGVLWEVTNGELLRFRCRVGHAYTAESLMADHDESLESALWVALRALEESASLSRRLANNARLGGHAPLTENFEDRASETEQHASVIRRMLLSDNSKQTAHSHGTTDAR